MTASENAGGVGNNGQPVRVEIKNKHFTRHDGNETQVLHDVAFEVRRGELVALTGPSGCGKTTLLKLIAGLDHDYEGRISLPKPRDGELELAYAFQEPCLLPWRTVRQNVRLAMSTESAPDEQQKRITALLDDMGLSHAADNYPLSLSAGMAQRAALARAFAVEAPLLIMDEPFSSIDERTAVHLRKLLLSQLQTCPRTVLFVTHNLREALFLSDRLLILSQRPATLLADLALQPARDGAQDGGQSKHPGRHLGRRAEDVERLHGEMLRRFPDVLG